ncbi:cytochrome b/b6 domain-containing protein [Salinibacterium sp. ZJ70]|uniref:cytochrome b/b6 domain-containing protein n=1 Tax=Salinibacterium sp. ZJ70 TaxID=2708084 RepID=UPI001CD3D4DE|nr:cytochrome b/b6 domain-containing protein [Salinibacterium sp. ZJ70]
MVLALAAKGIREIAPVRDFLVAYPGAYALPEGAPVGIPAWLGWQHFFNLFFLALIIRTGWTIRTDKRPTAFWTSRSGKPRMSLQMWTHQSLDVLWLTNGVVYVVLLFTTGQWMRIVPTSWDVVPNAVSSALLYASLDWPTEHGWVNYNALQQLAYFSIVFVAAPLAAATGVRMSPWWPTDSWASRLFPIEWARRIHFPVMLCFVLFIATHVILVLSTGALRNLGHMFASTDDVSWMGFGLFAASLVAVAAAWVALRPIVIAPLARLFGEVTAR